MSAGSSSWCGRLSPHSPSGSRRSPPQEAISARRTRATAPPRSCRHHRISAHPTSATAATPQARRWWLAATRAGWRHRVDPEPSRCTARRRRRRRVVRLGGRVHWRGGCRSASSPSRSGLSLSVAARADPSRPSSKGDSPSRGMRTPSTYRGFPLRKTPQLRGLPIQDDALGGSYFWRSRTLGVELATSGRYLTLRLSRVDPLRIAVVGSGPAGFTPPRHCSRATFRSRST